MALSIEDYFDLDTAFSMDFNILENNPQHKSPSSPAATEEEEDTDFFVSQMPTPPPGGICTVCMECFGPKNSSSLGKRLPCGHVYHATCIATWLYLHHSCPLCRCRIHTHRDETIPPAPAPAADYSA